MRRIVSLLAICAALVSCGNTGGKSTGDEFQSINWRDNDAAAVICVGMYTNESDLRDSRLLTSSLRHPKRRSGQRAV